MSDIPSFLDTATFRRLVLEAIGSGGSSGGSVVTNNGTFAVQNTAAIPAGANAIGSVSVSNFPASTEISNDVGNPVPVSGSVTANRSTGAISSAGGTAVAGTPVALTGSISKMLVIQNTATSGTLFVSTNATPSATNGISLSAGAGYEFLHIPSSTIYVASSAGSVTYGYIYA
jgi:hypothetical protein